MRGGIIAIIGPDAAGKSTLTLGLKKRLEVFGITLDAQPAYAPSTSMTRVLRFMALATRKILKIATPRAAVTDFPRIQAVLSVLTAIERRALVRSLTERARAGTLIVTDRFPGREPGSATGPAIAAASQLPIQYLSQIERRIYRAIPTPDVVIHLTSPVAETIRRNAMRPDPKPESLIVASHESAAKTHYPGVPSTTVDGLLPAERALEASLAFVANVLGDPRESVEL